MSLKLIACMVATIPHWANGDKSVVRKVPIDANGKEQPAVSESQHEPKAVVRRIMRTVEASGNVRLHNKAVARSAKGEHGAELPPSAMAQTQAATVHPEGILNEQTQSLASVNVALHSLEDRVEKIEKAISHTQAIYSRSTSNHRVCDDPTTIRRFKGVGHTLQACQDLCDAEADCNAIYGALGFGDGSCWTFPGICSEVSHQHAYYVYHKTAGAGSIELSGTNDAQATNLQRCIGECDSDAQCAAGLKCFQRENGETIPGCVGNGGGNNWDYCYNPNWAGRIELSGSNNANPTDPLNRCNGECDNDAQCAAGLECFQRENGETIPGCWGTGGGNDWDYCYDPNWCSSNADCHNGLLCNASQCQATSYKAVSGSYEGSATGHSGGFTKSKEEMCLLDTTSSVHHTTSNVDIAMGVVCCSTSGVGSRPDCKTGTHAEAVQHCASKNLQLCTIDQLKGGAGEASGCGFDGHMVWSSTGCEVPTPAPTQACHYLGQSECSSRSDCTWSYVQGSSYGCSASTPAPQTPAPPSTPAPQTPAPPTLACAVTVYEHWPEGITSDMLTTPPNASPEFKAGITWWNGNFPTGHLETFNVIGSHTILSTSGMLSSVKVTSSGGCCQAKGYKDPQCSEEIENMTAIKSNVVYEEALGAGVVAPGMSLKLKWGCNDCTMCVKLEQC